MGENGAEEEKKGVQLVIAWGKPRICYIIK